MDKETKKKGIVSDALQKGFQKILDESKVPFAVHMQVIKKLEQALKDHKGEIDSHQKNLQTYGQSIDNHTQSVASYKSELERTRGLAKGEQGTPGSQGSVGPQGPQGIPGIPGRTPIKGKDYFDGKPGTDGKSPVIDEDKLVEKMVALIKKKQILDTSSIKGLGEFVSNKAKGFTKDGVKYAFEELMHGGGSSSGSVSITYSVDLSAQANGSNKVFTVPANTAFILLTGTDSPFIYRPIVDYTGSGTTTLTLDALVNAPSSGSTFILTYKST